MSRYYRTAHEIYLEQVEINKEIKERLDKIIEKYEIKAENHVVEDLPHRWRVQALNELRSWYDYKDRRFFDTLTLQEKMKMPAGMFS